MHPASISLWYNLSSAMFFQDFIQLRILCLPVYCLIAIILPSVLCGCETCSLTSSEDRSWVNFLLDTALLLNDIIQLCGVIQ